MSKRLEYRLTHNDTIVEIKFITIPRKDWFKENIIPAIAVIKNFVPASMRAYKSAVFTWEIAIEFWNPLKTTLEAMQFYCQLKQDVVTAKVNVSKEYAENFYHKPEPITKVESKESLALKLSEYLGITIAAQELSELKKLYRQKARELHPDYNGGDGARMSELNRLWTLFSQSAVN